jgi:hypothetical protein
VKSTTKNEQILAIVGLNKGPHVLDPLCCW